METVETNKKAELSGDQIKFFRLMLGESQAQFGKRFDTSSAAIWRLEQNGSEKQSGPLIILIDLLAKEFEVDLPDLTRFRRQAHAAEISATPAE